MNRQPSADATNASHAGAPPLEVRPVTDFYNGSHGVLSGGRLIACVGNNAHRAWVAPLITPGGRNVLDAYPFDHPFHNGIFAGQGETRVGDRMAYFWAAHPDFRQADNPIFKLIGQVKYDAAPTVEVADGTATFGFQSTWCDAAGHPMLDERRTFAFTSTPDATLCRVTTERLAAYGDVRFAASKFGVIGVRAQPQLLPRFGGSVIWGADADLHVGVAEPAAGDNGQPWFVAYEGSRGGAAEAFGVCLIVPEHETLHHDASRWLVRDYGMAVFNPLLQRPLALSRGSAWSCSLLVVAYDGPLRPGRARGWQDHAQH